MSKNGKIMISCHEAVYLIAKRQEDKLTFIERSKLAFHLTHCKQCRRLNKQTRQVAKAIKNMNEKMRNNSVNLKLTEEQKKRIE
jgi:hypothetical protein